MSHTKKKKILYIITKSNFGGAQRYVLDLAIAQQIKGNEVAVALGGNGTLKEKLEETDITTISIKSFQRDISLFKEFKSLRELTKLFKNEKPDVVHLNSSKAGLLGALAARIASVKIIIFTAHGWPFLEPRNVYWRLLAWTGSFITALLCTKVILVSHHDFKHVRMPFVKNKMTVITTAVSDIAFKTKSEARTILFKKDDTARHQNDTWLITNAELNHNKNLFTAIDAVLNHNKSHSQKIFYSIIGDGELRKTVQDYIDKNNAGHFISLLGYIDAARTYLKAFDIFLLPSKKEGLPYALLEAGAAELPCIASLVGGIPEIIEHEKNGLLINPNNTSDIAKALHILTENPQTAEHYGRELKRKIVQTFALKRMIDDTEKTYRYIGSRASYCTFV